MTKDFGKSDWLYQSGIAPNLKEKIKCLEHVLLIDPDDGDVWFDLGDIHYENSNDKANYCWKIATKCYTKRLERFKEDAIKYRKNSNHLLFMDVSSANVLDEISSKMFSLASAYYNLDKYSLSAQYYLKSCEINSKSIDSLYYASRAFYELEQFDDAIKYVKQYIEKTDGYKSHYHLGLCYWKSNQIFLAQESFWECIEKTHNDATSHYYKSLSFHALGSKKHEELFLKKAIRADANNIEYKYDLIKFYEENNDSKNAQKYYNKIHKSKKGSKNRE